MAWWDRMDTRKAEEALQVAVEATNYRDLEDEVRYLGAELREAKEDLLKVSDAFDSVGWAPLSEDAAKEIDLKTVKNAAKVCRGMYTLNPFINRGINARIGYIWGRGVIFDGVDDIDDQIEKNRKKLFNDQAYTEFERTLATDGNSFTALPIDIKDEELISFRVPLDQIVGCISNPQDTEEIWYYKREWSVKTTNGVSGEVNERKEIKYYASMEYYMRLKKGNKNLPRRFKEIGVQQEYVIHHVAVNKQVGWRWGMPDAAPAVAWAKAYKEYLEDNATLVKAYARIAWQVQSGTASGAAAAGAQVMAPPTRDPLTGEQRYVGSTVITGPGTVASPTSAPGSAVDFSKGSALAAAIASALQVSKVVITSDPGDGNRATAETLDLPTLKAMESRQRLHTDRFLAIFEFWGAKVTPAALSNKKDREIQEALGTIPKPKSDESKLNSSSKPSKPKSEGPSGPDYALVTWPQIESDSTKDRIAAVGSAAELGIIFKQEARKDALDTLGIAPYKPWDELPTMEDDPKAMEQFEQQQQAADQAFQQQQVIAKQGVAGGVAAKGGAQSTANSARTNRAADSKSK